MWDGKQGCDYILQFGPFEALRLKFKVSLTCFSSEPPNRIPHRTDPVRCHLATFSRSLPWAADVHLTLCTVFACTFASAALGRCTACSCCCRRIFPRAAFNLVVVLTASTWLPGEGEEGKKGCLWFTGDTELSGRSSFSSSATFSSRDTVKTAGSTDFLGPYFQEFRCWEQFRTRWEGRQRVPREILM